MKIHNALAPIAALALMSGCAPAEEAPVPDYEADRAAIQAIHDAEIAAGEAGDVEAFLAFIAPDMKVFQPNAPLVEGPGAAQAWLEAFTSAYTIAFDGYVVDEILVDGDLAVEEFSGSWTVTPKDGGEAVTEVLKGLHLYRRQADGSWRMTHDIWNSDMPLPGM